MSRRAAIALAAVFLGLTAGGTAVAKTKKEHHHHHRHHHREKPGAEGKDHLKRANALAGEGDCAAAIEEYTKAYELLSDPVVLFNRGECYRRTGKGENAVDDYRAFLDKVPNAPNRAAIEAKIVALEVPEPAAREGTKPTAKPAGAETSKPVARETTKPPAGETSKPVARETPKPPPAETPKVTVLSPAPPKGTEETPPAAPPPPAPKPEDKAEPAVVVGAARGEDSTPSGGSRPWVWIALSVLAVGAAVGGYVLLRPKEEPPPASTLGNYPF